MALCTYQEMSITNFGLHKSITKGQPSAKSNQCHQAELRTHNHQQELIIFQVYLFNSLCLERSYTVKHTQSCIVLTLCTNCPQQSVGSKCYIVWSPKNCATSCHSEKCSVQSVQEECRYYLQRGSRNRYNKFYFRLKNVTFEKYSKLYLLRKERKTTGQRELQKSKCNKMKACMTF